jgi:HD-GYP domain-containing protein (c-di-GMP phosphodiesterase class II)
MAVRNPRGWAKLVLATLPAIAIVVIDQVARGEPLLAEWWIDLPLAGAFAVTAWLALSRDGDPDVLGAEVQRVHAIDEVMIAVNRGADAEQVLQSLARQACRIMRVERTLVLLRDESDPRTSVVVAGHGVPPDMIGLRFGVDEGMAGQAITTGAPFLVDDYRKFSRPLSHEAAEGLCAGGAAPIRCGNRVRGALTAGTTDPERRFGEPELEALRRLAELGSVALEQAQVRDQLETAVETGVDAMAAAIDMRDDYTGDHSHAVVKLARSVGERMGLREHALVELEFAARLHDVGKIGVPDAVLRKDGPLEGAEWAVMRKHPEWGAQMLARVPGLKRVSKIVLHAHERWDGDGYPDRLQSEEIPIESRIILACDAFDAMTSNRPYREAMQPWIAVSELREGAGGQFDPEVVDVLVGALRQQRGVPTSLFMHPEHVRQGA